MALIRKVASSSLGLAVGALAPSAERAMAIGGPAARWLENHGKTMGKSWENGELMRENRAKYGSRMAGFLIRFGYAKLGMAGESPKFRQTFAVEKLAFHSTHFQR